MSEARVKTEDKPISSRSGILDRTTTWFRQKTMALSDRTHDFRDGIQARQNDETVDDTDHVYFPSPRRLILTTIFNVPGKLEDLTFVDYGSGKGRVLFTAAKNRFQQVLGIEYLPELHKHAVENEERFREKFPESSPITLINDDAANFEIPETDCLLNFYNPFGEEIFNKVMDRIVNAHQKHGNKIFVCYQQSRNEPEATNTRNIQTLEDNPIFKSRTFRYRSLWDRILLGIYTIKMFETR